MTANGFLPIVIEEPVKAGVLHISADETSSALMGPPPPGLEGVKVAASAKPLPASDFIDAVMSEAVRVGCLSFQSGREIPASVGRAQELFEEDEPASSVDERLDQGISEAVRLHCLISVPDEKIFVAEEPTQDPLAQRVLPIRAQININQGVLEAVRCGYLTSSNSSMHRKTHLQTTVEKTEVEPGMTKGHLDRGILEAVRMGCLNFVRQDDTEISEITSKTCVAAAQTIPCHSKPFRTVYERGCPCWLFNSCLSTYANDIRYEHNGSFDDADT